MIKNHWISKEKGRNNQIRLVKGLITLKKKWALRKLCRLNENKQEYIQKMTLAEVFNSQYMYQQSFKSWVNYFKQNQVNIRKGALIKQNSSLYKKKVFLNMWLQASWKPLRKLQGVNRIAELSQKLLLINKLRIWKADVRHQRELDNMVEQFQERRERSMIHHALKRLDDYCLTKINQRNQLASLDEYYKSKLMHKSVQSLRWYVDEKREKREMT